MSFKLIMTGIFGIFVSFVVGAFSLMQTIPVFLSIIINMAFGIILSFIILFVAIMTNGILEPFISARIRGKTLAAIITPSKTIELVSGYEEEGFLETKRGYINVVPDASYTWPNGTKGGIAYYKYGVLLPDKIVRAVTKLKKTGIKDGKQLSMITNELKKNNEDLIIEVD